MLKSSGREIAKPPRYNVQAKQGMGNLSLYLRVGAKTNVVIEQNPGYGALKYIIAPDGLVTYWSLQDWCSEFDSQWCYQFIHTYPSLPTKQVHVIGDENAGSIP